jgi:hypothetical protein
MPTILAQHTGLAGAKAAIMDFMEEIPLPSADEDEVTTWISGFRTLLVSVYDSPVSQVSRLSHKKSYRQILGSKRLDDDIRRCCKIVLTDLEGLLSQGVIFNLRAIAGGMF